MDMQNWTCKTDTSMEPMLVSTLMACILSYEQLHDGMLE